MMIKSSSSALVVIDVQERLAPMVAETHRLVDRIIALLDASEKLNIPVVTTEHYPGRIGPTIPPVRRGHATIVEKTTFSAASTPAFARSLRSLQRPQLIMVGMEAHVCLLQTALDLLTQDHAIFVVADAVGSRHPDSKSVALTRLRDAGAHLVTTEMVLFEWLEDGDHPAFKEVLSAIKAFDR